MTEKWINEAFNQAQESLQRTQPRADAITEFLERGTPRIMDMWRMEIGEEAYNAFIKVIAQHDELIHPIGRLTEYFTTAGYLLAKTEQENS